MNLEEYYQEFKKEFEINEGLIITHSLSQTCSILSRKNCKITTKQNYNSPKIIIETILNDDILKTINNLGWFISFIISEKYSGKISDGIISKLINSNVKITLEAKYDILLDEKELPNFIYHITTVDKLNKIKNKGLVPKSNTKLNNHPERIYFSLTRNDSDELLQRLKRHISPTKEQITLKINTKDLQSFVKFYYDVNSKGIYTMNNINPLSIEIE